MATQQAPLDLAGLTLDSFAGRRVAVLGLARSGIALTRFLVARGAQVTVYDGRSADDLADALRAIEAADRSATADGPAPGLRLLLGPDVDPALALSGQSLICTSPAVSSLYPTTEPRLRAALADVEARGTVPVVSEVDLFLRLCPAVTIGVTGTKGKTTTSSLIAAVLRAGSAPVVLGGNIGQALIEALPDLARAHRVVLELSELQLATLSRGTTVAVYTHVTADHLDRHGSLEAYRAAKRRLADLVPVGGTLIRNDDDPVVAGYHAPTGARTVSYGRSRPAPDSVGVADGWVVADPAGRILPLSDIPLPGEHSVSNVLAAVAVGLVLGIPPAGIAAAVRAFPGVEHRLELVTEAEGVRYVNDSQGTQPDAVIAALRAFPKPLVLIAGGRSKGLAIEALSAEVAERASAAVLMGETADELADGFATAGLGRIERAGSMDEAVRTATRLARAERVDAAPATVLLSPAAASFDMFVDYEARGAAFKAAVAAVIAATDGSR